ncbi:MAG TPA: oxidoreductase [Alphaproteobacteria bacterium]|nr:oxidoreductase [Alphaproteobacteria bacterium]HAM47852.1 oxidoreductase [Alphaproteobacteria bacterium]HBA41854.1 oxidoreductase [Alphaproteobacteria bacterium]
MLLRCEPGKKSGSISERGSLIVKLVGQKILVTGGGRGIGRALATQLLRQGNQVAICGRNGAQLEAVRAEHAALHTIVHDISDTGALPRLIEQAVAAMDGLSVLVNNAGIQHECDFVAGPMALLTTQLLEEMTINLAAPALLARAAIPYLAVGGPAAIVNVTSGLALAPKKDAPIYCASKAALHSFTRALRYQIEDSGADISVHDVLMPMVETDMTAGRTGNKLTADDAAKALIAGVERGKAEIAVGQVGILRWLMRLAPAVGYRILRDG